jgi:O-antigen/teichoic acid export membrane protein
MIKLREAIQTLFVQKLGIDATVSFNVLAKVTQALGGFVNILLIANFLSIEEQGYYYTFASLLGMQVFFELGLTNLITQYVAHEKAHLNWNNAELEGSTDHVHRLSSILRFTIYWFSSISMVLCIFLIVAGYFFFQSFSANDIEWQGAWIVVSISTSMLLIFSALLAFYEGLEKLKETAFIRFWVAILQICFQVVLFVMGAKLFSLGISIFFSVMVGFILLSYSSKHIFKNIWIKFSNKTSVNWREEVLPYQWRMALSAASGYLIFQLFNPVVFAVEGAKIAGQVGMTLAVITGISSICQIWLRIKIPTMSIHIARKEFQKLDTVFSLALGQSTFIIFTGFVFFILAISYGYQDFSWGQRFLPFFPALIFITISFLQFIMNGLAVYLRCHKKEPFLIHSIFAAVATVCCIFAASNILQISIYYLVINLVVLAFSWRTFQQKKEDWHAA